MIDAQKITQILESELKDRAEISVEQGVGRVGGGALPMSDLVGPRVSIRPTAFSAARLEKSLRKGNPPVITIVKEDSVLLDPRTFLETQAQIIPGLIVEAFRRIKN